MHTTDTDDLDTTSQLIDRLLEKQAAKLDKAGQTADSSRKAISHRDPEMPPSRNEGTRHVLNVHGSAASLLGLLVRLNSSMLLTSMLLTCTLQLVDGAAEADPQAEAEAEVEADPPAEAAAEAGCWPKGAPGLARLLLVTRPSRALLLMGARAPAPTPTVGAGARTEGKAGHSNAAPSIALAAVAAVRVAAAAGAATRIAAATAAAIITSTAAGVAAGVVQEAAAGAATRVAARAAARAAMMVAAAAALNMAAGAAAAAAAVARAAVNIAAGATARTLAALGAEVRTVGTAPIPAGAAQRQRHVMQVCLSCASQLV
jgi:hypothetical protein